MLNDRFDLNMIRDSNSVVVAARTCGPNECRERVDVLRPAFCGRRLLGAIAEAAEPNYSKGRLYARG